MKWANVPFRLESGLVKLWFDLTKQRPSSAPFISGDTLRLLAHHRYEKANRQAFVPEAVQPGQVIFCEGDIINDFFAGPGQKITCQFVFLSHNDDTNIDQAYLKYLDKHVIRWYAQNVVVRHDRLIPVPIGLENKVRYWHGIPKDFQKLRNGLAETNKKLKILYGFAIVNNPEARSIALKSLQKHPFAEALIPTNSRKYRRLLSKYAFVASPPGHGEDCLRTWEAMYLRVVPIVKRSVGTEFFRSLGLPLLLIDSWEELATFDETKLANCYADLAPGFDTPALWFDYWKNDFERFKTVVGS
jgi:hypothetical protein